MHVYSIRQDQFNAIKKLTEIDRKNALGCAFKVVEENGELASALQGLFGMDGAHHRFTTQEKILEEVADITLAALSFGLKVDPDSEVNCFAKAINLQSVVFNGIQPLERWAYWLEQLNSLTSMMLDIHNSGMVGSKVFRSCLTIQSMLNELSVSQEQWEDMLSSKIDKWAQIQEVEMQNKGVYPFELHVTIQEAQHGDFYKACEHLGVKPIVLDLQLAESVMKDVMTSSVIITDGIGAIQELTRIQDGLSDAGFEVIRGKIETVPWHPAAPSQINQRSMPESCYFEAHVAVPLRNDNTLDDNRDLLGQVCGKHALHLSRNIRKKTDKHVIIMATLRCYTGTSEHFKSVLKDAVTDLEAKGFDISKTITEFAIFDSNVHHDQSWLSIESR